ncbi:MAG: hypothetical protein ACYS5V_10880, partial [Planctomycetota bacterium]
MSGRAETTRRDFLRAAARGAALAALGAVAAVLLLGDRDGCARRRRCDDCPLLADCSLPAAEKAR